MLKREHFPWKTEQICLILWFGSLSAHDVCDKFVLQRWVNSKRVRCCIGMSESFDCRENCSW